jgi:hypothetical protein
VTEGHGDRVGVTPGQLADRLERGSWYRATAQQVRHAIGNRSARQAPREAAKARQAVSIAEAQAKRQRAERVRARRRSRAQVRREKLRALARLLASGSASLGSSTSRFSTIEVVLARSCSACRGRLTLDYLRRAPRLSS